MIGRGRTKYDPGGIRSWVPHTATGMTGIPDCIARMRPPFLNGLSLPSFDLDPSGHTNRDLRSIKKGIRSEDFLWFVMMRTEMRLWQTASFYISSPVDIQTEIYASGERQTE